MNVRTLGDSTLIVSGLDDGVAATFASALRKNLIDGVTEVAAAFESIAIHYDPSVFEPTADPIQRIQSWAQSWAMNLLAPATVTESVSTPRQIEIPVRYGGETGPDLVELARLVDLSPEDVIRLHSAAEYRVLAVGFMPGFGYLGGLPEKLHVPRRSTPRTCVAAGSLGIGGPYTGVYPFASPGGWNLIGHTAVPLFDPQRGSTLSVGDVVRFKSINNR